jgi:hypothetical protein
MDRMLKQLRLLQQRLGNISDCGVTRRFAVLHLDKSSPESRRLVKSLSAAVAAERRELAAFWRNSFGREGEEQRWVRYLGRDAIGRAQTAGVRRPAARSGPG